MCLICDCEKKNDYSILSHTTILDIHSCKYVKEIPDNICFNNTSILYCHDCDNLKKIGGSFPVLKVLDCKRCINLIEIPIILGLKELNCSYCNSLTEIPKIKGIREIDCSFCEKLTKINTVTGIRCIICENCPLLTEITESVYKSTNLAPNFFEDLPREFLDDIKNKYPDGGIRPVLLSLHELWCANCRYLIKFPFVFYERDYRGCPWAPDDDYEDNIKSLKTIQSFCRKKLRYFAFKRWIKSRKFNEWFYSPDNIGGKMAKKILKTFLEPKIENKS